MIAILLCSGVGSRLGIHTTNRPKCLVEVVGKPLLGYQLEALRSAGINQVVITTGYLHTQIEEFASASCKLIHNERYLTTNSIYSLWLAREYAGKDDILIINGDVIFDYDLITQIVKPSQKTSALVDNKQVLHNGEMNVRIENGKIVEFSKEILAEKAHALSLQITRFDSKDSIILFDRIEQLINTGHLDKFPAFAYQNVIEKSALYPVFRNRGMWFEIDTPKDLEKAEKELLSHIT